MANYTNEFRAILLQNPFTEHSPTLFRSFPIEPVPGKAWIYTGVRRSGKTTAFRQVRKYWLGEGVPESAIAYVDFTDERLIGLPAKSLGDLLTVFDEQVGTSSRRSVLLLDEIHEIEGWEKFVHRVLAQPGRQVYITGSSARLLGREIATQMRGRSLRHEFFPFSFRERLEFAKIETTGRQESAHVRALFRSFLTEGGFPEATGLSDTLKRKLLREYFDLLLLRDVIERNRATNIPALKFLFARLLGHPASAYTINKLFEQMKSLGYRLDKSSITEWIGWFEDCYALYTVPLLTPSIAKQNTNPKKI